ncbi:MAG: kinase/pyrophosphorylase [Gammaproteobacteria bacterium]|nr:kinase/pyrophosphorylase [Gammaproteobacteria bacterium]
MNRIVFFVSDSTAITAETLGRSLLTQFKQFTFERITMPFVNTLEKAQKALEEINKISREQQAKVIVFSTLVDPHLRKILSPCNGLFIDFFDQVMPALKKELHAEPEQKIGQTHGIDPQIYSSRIEAINFALDTDDGLGIKHYDKADVILIGVSRSGKTPTCLYLALQFRIHAANYPITEEDMHSGQLPKSLETYRPKLFGLTIDPERLHEIREQRSPNSRYASLDQCQYETTQIERLFQQSNIPYLNSTHFSIEEISTRIMNQMGIKR